MKPKMIYYVKGDLFESPAQTLVNTVNTVGVMGKGIAKQFKAFFPDMFTQYRGLCERGEFRIGQLWLYKTAHKWILNFPTKTDWRQPSRVDYIESGLKKLVASAGELGIHSIAFPALGCGNGELSWDNIVRPMMEKYLSPLPIDVFIYPHRPSSEEPEHRRIDEIRKWLHSEPQALAFSEVWNDLGALIARKKTFHTLHKKASFAVEFCDAPPGIRIPDRNAFISRNTILNVWQQIRSYGFTARPLAPGGLDKDISYLQPILAELDYIRVVPLSQTYRGLTGNAAFGLQYVAPSRKDNSDLDLFVDQPVQMR